MVDNLIAFATTHYLLAAALVIILALLISHEMSLGGRSLSTSELTALVNKDEAVIVDIRSAKDFATGHIFGALNIEQNKLIPPLDKMEKYKSKIIILVDVQGQHSGAQAREMLKAGFNTVKLSGGIGGWKADNLPLVK